MAEASASRSCGGGPGGLLFVCLFIYLFLNLAEAAASAASMQFTALPRQCVKLRAAKVPPVAEAVIRRPACFTAVGSNPARGRVPQACEKDSTLPGVHAVLLTLGDIAKKGI